MGHSKTPPGGDVIRRRFTETRSGHQSLARSNARARVHNEDEIAAWTTNRGYRGHMFRVIEIWSQASVADRKSALDMLEDMRARTHVERLAYEFTQTEDVIHVRHDIRTIALARAFHVYVYGDTSQ